MIEPNEPTLVHSELLLLCDVIAEHMTVLSGEVQDLRSQVDEKEHSLADLRERLRGIRQQVYSGGFINEALPRAMLLRGAK